MKNMCGFSRRGIDLQAGDFRLNNGIRFEVQKEAGDICYLTVVKILIIIVHNHTIKIEIV